MIFVEYNDEQQAGSPDNVAGLCMFKE